MKFEDLIRVDLAPYNKYRYEQIRAALNQKLDQMVLEKNRNMISHYEMAIHLSFCVQNLHKNFVNKLIELLQWYNKNDNKLPAEMYFEPSRPKVFPPPPKTDDDLPLLNKMLIHHANFYDMKSMPVTWMNLVEQYLDAIEFAIKQNLLDECVKVGNDGCFDNCISEMGVWKTVLSTSTDIDNGASSSYSTPRL